MDDIKKIAAMLSMHQFLIGQLYVNAFLHDQDARQSLPKALIDATKYRSTVAPDGSSDPADIAEIQKQVAHEIERFFTDVERRVQESLDRAPR